MDEIINSLRQIYQDKYINNTAEVIVKNNLIESIYNLKEEIPELTGKELLDAKEQLRLYRKCLYNS
ncbi:hypothetical protein [Natronospora cellulosivora (SeqCode)]